MKFQSIRIDADNNLLVEENNGSLTRLICPYSGKPCGFSCPHCGRPADYGPLTGPGYYLDLHCASRTTRIEAYAIAYKLG